MDIFEGITTTAVMEIFTDSINNSENITANQTLKNDSSYGDRDYYDMSSWKASQVQKIITLSILMFMSLVGNSVIITVLLCSRHHTHLNRVNIYIINLAIGDLAVCCMTMTSELILEIYGEWRLGNAGCKIIMYTQIVTLSSTTYILMAMSWDRYQAICNPLDFNPSSSKARKMVLCAWIAALIFALPNLFIYVQVEDGIHEDGTPIFSCYSKGYTESWQRKVNFIWLSCSVFIFPALWIAFCYFSVVRVVWQQGSCQKTESINGFTLLRKTCDIRVIPRAKIKTLKMSLTIVLTFLICWTPYFVVYNILVFSDDDIYIPETVITLVDSLALLNSALNPLIYGVFNLRIKQGLQEACCFNLSVESNKSRISEPTISTSTSTIRLKNRRKENEFRVRTQRQPNGESSFEFVQSTRHIQNKRSRTIERLAAKENSRNGNDTTMTIFQKCIKEQIDALTDF